MDDQKKLKQKAKLWVGVAILIVVVVLGIASSVDNADKKIDVVETVALEVNENDWVKGDLNSSVVIVEYADFQCPACQAYSSLMKDVENKYGDQVAIVFRHFPLNQIHKNATLAASAAEAAGVQGKFWEMHDMLFEKQSEWSDSNKAADMFLGYAENLDLDKDQFIVDTKDKSIRQKISQSFISGQSFGVKGTPSFFVNGVKISNPRSFDEFSGLIEENL